MADVNATNESRKRAALVNRGDVKFEGVYVKVGCCYYALGNDSECPGGDNGIGCFCGGLLFAVLGVKY